MKSKYRVASIDLADQRTQTNIAAPIDAPRAAELYESAWRAGVPIGAYKLGRMYEDGTDTAGGARLGTEPEKAWRWYRLGAKSGEPYALARCAEYDEGAALEEKDLPQRDRLFFSAFAEYATAAEHARLQDWPDAAWMHWRYRRASLARLLASDGKMQQVADTYRRIVGGN